MSSQTALGQHGRREKGEDLQLAERRKGQLGLRRRRRKRVCDPCVSRRRGVICVEKRRRL